MGRLGHPCRRRAHGPGSRVWGTPEAPGLRGQWGRCSPRPQALPGADVQPGGRRGQLQGPAAPPHLSRASDPRLGLPLVALLQRQDAPRAPCHRPGPSLDVLPPTWPLGDAGYLASGPLLARGRRAVPLAPTQPTQARCASSFPAQSCPCPHLPRAAHQPARPTPSWALGHLGELLLASTACSPTWSPRLGSL